MNATIINPINLFLLILGTYLGIKLSIFLLNKSTTKNNENKYLGWLIFIQSLAIIIGCLYRFDLLGYFSHLIGIQSLYHFLIGPLAYFYVRACTQKGFQFRPILWLHFLPFVVDVLYNIPFFLLSGTQKLAFYEQFVIDGILYSPAIWNAIKTIHALFYFGFCIQLIQQYRKYLPNAVSSIDKAFHRWLLLFIFLIAMPILVNIFFITTEYSRAYTILTFLIGLIAFFVAIDTAILVKPELFQTFPHQILLATSSEDKKQKYESSKLVDLQKDKYIEKLAGYMVVNQPHLEPELTLAQLSEQIKIPTHYLSQVINEKLNCNFLDFVNGYRVEAVKQKLKDSKYSHYTIISIAYDAGFNAKSTFYAAFKKQTGMTPNQYRKQAKMIAA